MVSGSYVGKSRCSKNYCFWSGMRRYPLQDVAETVGTLLTVCLHNCDYYAINIITYFHKERLLTNIYLLLYLLNLCPACSVWHTFIINWFSVSCILFSLLTGIL